MNYQSLESRNSFDRNAPHFRCFEQVCIFTIFRILFRLCGGQMKRNRNLEVVIAVLYGIGCDLPA